MPRFRRNRRKLRKRSRYDDPRNIDAPFGFPDAPRQHPENAPRARFLIPGENGTQFRCANLPERGQRSNARH